MSDRDRTFTVELTLADADAVFRLSDMDAALGIDDDFDDAHDALFSAESWNAILDCTSKILDAADGRHAWKMFCLGWPLVFAAALYGRE